MDKTLIAEIRERFELENSLLRLETMAEEANQAHRQAKYNLREAQHDRLDYTSGFRAFLDKFSGKREEKELALDRAVKQAETAVTVARQEEQRLTGEIAELRDKLTHLPSPEELKAKAEGETFTEFIRLDSRLTLKILEPLLAENLESLEELRKIRRGERVGEIKSRAEWTILDTMPEQQTRDLTPLLKKLVENLPHLGMELTLGEYFREPTVFLNPAARHNQLDSVSRAIGQVEAVQRQLRELWQKL